MLLNNLDPEVAEHPEELIVYGGSGRAAARNPEALARARPDVSSRRRRDPARPEWEAGRVLRRIVRAAGPHSELAAVPRWATWDEFRRLEPEGLTMFGQMTAGSWICTFGTQGILQGTYLQW